MNEDLRDTWTHWNNNHRWIDNTSLSLNKQDRNEIRKSIEDVEYRQARIKIDVFLLILLQVVIIIIVVVRTSNFSNFKHLFLHRLKVYWFFLQLLLSLVVKLLSWDQYSVLIKSTYHWEIRLLFIFQACHFRSSCLQQFDTWCLCPLRDSQKLCISMNIILQSFLNVSKNKVTNIKSLRRNDKLSFFVTVLNSLQNSWKKNFHMLIEAERSLKRRFEKNIKIKTSSRWSISAFFFKEFKNKVRKNNQIRTYSRQFRNISSKLIKWRQLNIYTQCS